MGVKRYWEMIADKLSASGWSWGQEVCVAACICAGASSLVRAAFVLMLESHYCWPSLFAIRRTFPWPHENYRTRGKSRDSIGNTSDKVAI